MIIYQCDITVLSLCAFETKLLYRKSWGQRGFSQFIGLLKTEKHYDVLTIASIGILSVQTLIKVFINITAKQKWELYSELTV